MKDKNTYDEDYDKHKNTDYIYYNNDKENINTTNNKQTKTCFQATNTAIIVLILLAANNKTRRSSNRMRDVLSENFVTTNTKTIKPGGARTVCKLPRNCTKNLFDKIW